MAINLQFTGREVPIVGTVGQTAGFVDFTTTQKQQEEYFVISPEEFFVDPSGGYGETTSNSSLNEIVADLLSGHLTIFLNGVLTDTAKTYEVKAFAVHAKRVQVPASQVVEADKNKEFIEFLDRVKFQVRFEVLVV